MKLAFWLGMAALTSFSCLGLASSSTATITGKCVLFTAESETAPYVEEETPEFSITGSLAKSSADDKGCEVSCSDGALHNFSNGIKLETQICTCGGADPYVATSTSFPEPYGFLVGQTANVPSELNKEFRLTTQFWQGSKKVNINGKELHVALLRCSVKRVK